MAEAPVQVVGDRGVGGFCRVAVPSSSTCLATLGGRRLGLTVTAPPPTKAMIGAVPASPGDGVVVGDDEPVATGQLRSPRPR